MIMICSKCHTKFPESSFYKSSVNSTGFDYWCKLCRKQYQRDRFQRKKSEIAAKRRQRYKDDVQFRLGVSLRNRVSNLFKTGSAVSDLGCGLDELKCYIESLWEPGMTWQNYGLHGWHIDHIIPVSAVDLSNPEEFKKVCHYTNLQPLWAKENLSKGGRLQ